MSISLQKGQKVNLTKENAGLSKMLFCFLFIAVYLDVCVYAMRV